MHCSYRSFCDSRIWFTKFLWNLFRCPSFHGYFNINSNLSLSFSLRNSTHLHSTTLSHQSFNIYVCFSIQHLKITLQKVTFEIMWQSISMGPSTPSWPYPLHISSREIHIIPSPHVRGEQDFSRFPYHSNNHGQERDLPQCALRSCVIASQMLPSSDSK